MNLISDLKIINITESLIDEKKELITLKESNIPCVLYGAGEVAEKIYNLLYNNGIIISDICVDNDSSATFHGKKVISFESVAKKYDLFNIVLGHNRYDKRSLILNKYENICQVFCFYTGFDWDEGFSIKFLSDNIDLFEKAYELSADSISKKVFLNYLFARIHNDPFCIVSENILEHRFNNDIVMIDNNGVFVDIGACCGNMIDCFIRETNGQFKKIIALEPDDINYELLVKHCKNINDKRIETVHIGCWDKRTILNFSREGTGRSNHVDLSGISPNSISVDKLDTILKGTDVTIINLFSQTGLTEIINGAKSIINNQSPLLIIGIGLRKEQIFEIPVLIKQIMPDYNLYYRFFGGVPSQIYLIAST